MKHRVTRSFHFLLLTVILIFLITTSCRTVKFSKYDVPNPNTIDLPGLLAEVDIPNMQYEAISQDTVLMGNVMVTKVFNYSDTNINSLPLVEMFPSRVHEIVELFGIDVKNNINGEDTIPYGIIKLEIHDFEFKNNKPLMFLTGWTLGALCLVGVPATNNQTILNLRVTIFDGNNKKIKSYESIGTGKAYMACYWGYGKDLKKKSNLLAYHDAMKNIKSQIKSDKDSILSKLTSELKL